MPITKKKPDDYNKPFFSLGEACYLLSVSPNTLKKYMVIHTFGNKRVVKKEDIYKSLYPDKSSDLNKQSEFDRLNKVDNLSTLTKLNTLEKMWASNRTRNKNL